MCMNYYGTRVCYEYFDYETRFCHHYHVKDTDNGNNYLGYKCHCFDNNHVCADTFSCFPNKGYREFDVAPNYGFGKSEEILGEVFYNKDVLINTKIGNNSKKKKAFSVRFLEKSFYQSLDRLKKRSVNILFVHNPRRIKNR